MNQNSRHLKRKREGVNRYAISSWKLWGGTKELYIQQYQKQQGLCDICSTPIRSRFEPETPERIELPMGCFDHCHKLQRPRGILCQPCNVALGYYETRILKYREEIKVYRRRYQ